MLSALLWLPLLFQAPGTNPSLVTRAYWEESRETAGKYTAAGVKFVPFVRVYFQTSAPIPAGLGITVQVTFHEDYTSDGCGWTYGSVPRPVDGWYTVYCTLRNARDKTIKELTVQPMQDKVTAQKLTDE